MGWAVSSDSRRKHFLAGGISFRGKLGLGLLVLLLLLLLLFLFGVSRGCARDLVDRVSEPRGVFLGTRRDLGRRSVAGKVTWPFPPPPQLSVACSAGSLPRASRPGLAFWAPGRVLVLRSLLPKVLLAVCTSRSPKLGEAVVAPCQLLIACALLAPTYPNLVQKRQRE